MRSHLRVLLISSIKYWGGGEAWMLTVAQGLIARGHHVTLVCQPGSRLEGRAQKAGVWPVTIRLRGDLDPLAVARLTSLIRRRDIQLVCANMDKEVRLAGLAAKLFRVPLVRRRGSDLPFPNKLRFRLVDRHFVRLIIVNSRATRETLLKGNPWLSEKRLRLIYNGIRIPDLEEECREDVLGELGCPRSRPVLVMVGLLKARKGHGVLFDALPGLIGQFPETALLVVGEGPLRSSLQQQVDKLGIARHVRFTGFRDDVSRLIRAADMLVLPSQNEGFGYVLAEAMSLAKPVVASRVSSIPEVVVDGQTGILVPPDDPRSLREALLQLAADPQRARCLGQAGRRRVEELFSFERMMDEVEDLFGQVVAGVI